ncbi:N-acetyltransferase [Myroides sp. M-43]|uniref:GNAT family N-acetyltransferase n=1 Tax=Myroides oncorhynchi TaxID=2893756 RepID=UPI001E2B557F|nr:GNAT family N-acetyltransferase [Myroides oncorhynchi]MCC9042986.1 N-acetyltransferase [Myroides oncorhynchi]
MKEEFVTLDVNKNADTKRFELTVDSYTAFIDYAEEGKVIQLIHTESPEELAGRGVATALIEKSLMYIEDNGYELFPLCPLVYAYIKRHPEWKRIVSKVFPAYDKL